MIQFNSIEDIKQLSDDEQFDLGVDLKQINKQCLNLSLDKRLEIIEYLTNSCINSDVIPQENKTHLRLNGLKN